MSVKLNNADNHEPIQVWISEEKTPIAYKNKFEELMESGAFDNEEDAKRYIESTPFELELYYEKDYGLFAVESGAVESGTIYSPYSGEFSEDADY